MDATTILDNGDLHAKVSHVTRLNHLLTNKHNPVFPRGSTHIPMLCTLYLSADQYESSGQIDMVQLTVIPPLLPDKEELSVASDSSGDSCQCKKQ